MLLRWIRARKIITNKFALLVGRETAMISLESMTDVKVGVNLLSSQHIIVSTATGAHRFVVYHGKEWFKKIKEAIMLGLDS